jgi:transcriptional regulator with XRE-family HTH domain
VENAQDAQDAERRFGVRVRQERLRRGWRQEDLAIRVAAEGVSLHFTAFTKIEAGHKRVRLIEAVAIAAALDVPLTFLLSSGNPSETARELEQVRGEFAKVQAESDDALARAAALWNRAQELTAVLASEQAATEGGGPGGAR